MTPPIIPPRTKFCIWSTAEFGAKFPFPVTLMTNTKEIKPKANLIKMFKKFTIICSPPQVPRLFYTDPSFLIGSYLGQILR